MVVEVTKCDNRASLLQNGTKYSGKKIMAVSFFFINQCPMGLYHPLDGITNL